MTDDASRARVTALLEATRSFTDRIDGPRGDEEVFVGGERGSYATALILLMDAAEAITPADLAWLARVGEVEAVTR